MKYLSNKNGFLGIDNKFSFKEKVIVVPFGLEKTVSYGGGTRNGPKEIIKASHQVELYDEELNCEPFKKIGIKTLKPFKIEKILKNKKFNSLGIKSFGAIPLNQVPGDENSIKGHNVRGTYWTLPDETGKEAERDKPIDEAKYTEIIPDFKSTYFEEVYNTLKKKFKLGRIKNFY